MKKGKPFKESNILKIPYFWVLIGFGIAAFFAIWLIPEKYYESEYEVAPKTAVADTVKVASDSAGTAELIAGEERIKKKIESIQSMRNSIIQICAGFLAIIGLILMIIRTRALVDQNYKTILLDQFSKASELLQSKDITWRLSGIYMFEKIMNESEEYHWQVIELLTAYVRENRSVDKYLIVDKPYLRNRTRMHDKKVPGAKEEVISYFYYERSLDLEIIKIEKRIRKVPVEKDIQAIITTLGRRNRDFEKDIITNNLKYFSLKKYINLSNTNLLGAEFTEGNFNWFSFSKSILINTNCNMAHFENAECYEAHFENAVCNKAHFENANCCSAHFENANCCSAHFVKADCEETHFENAICSEAHFDMAECWAIHFENADCSGTYFENADCESAYFENADCNKANFERTEFIYADFKSTSSLTVEQLLKANTLRRVTNLDPKIEEELRKLKPELFEDI